MDWNNNLDHLYYIDGFPWRLDVPWWDISKQTLELLYVADRFQEEHFSLRKAQKETGIAKSTLHKFIHGELGHYCSELQHLCITQLEWNKRNIKWFMQQKKWKRW